MSKIYLICILAGVVIGAVLIIIDMLSHLDSYKYEVDEAPTVDVVRCKDCKWHDTADCPLCEVFDPSSPDDWYCAEGKRRDDDEG